jgi:SAM-dependent methyltransferase
MAFRVSREETENSHWWFAGRREIIRVLAAGFPAGPQLEVGCGWRGVLSPGEGIRVGLDIEAEKLASVEKHGVKAVAGQGEQLPFADGSFLSVLLLDVLEHVRDDWLALAEAFRVLQPGGKALVTVPAYPSLHSPHDDAEFHLRRYRKRGLLRLCRGAGFQVVRSGHFNLLLFLPAAAWRVVSRRLYRHRLPASDFYMFPRPINSFLAALFSLERFLLRPPLPAPPFGLSLFAVLEKP